MQWDSGYGKPTQRATDAVFGVTADLIEIRDRVVFGVRQTIDIDTSRYTVDRRGFALVDLVSRGDIRTLAATAISNFGTALQSPGNIDLTAAQIYPASGV
ncbi:hypothetical protein HKX42_11135, partial [Salinisphaera sp. USBA-960]|nr:hypothetical protein [Salifodinibacter halophilus]